MLVDVEHGVPPPTCTTKSYAPWATDSSAILHGCLRHHSAYNEHTARAHRQIIHAA